MMWGLLALLAAQSVPALAQQQVCEGVDAPAGPHALLDVRLDERPGEALARSTIRFERGRSGPLVYSTHDRFDLRLHQGGRTLALTGIGGMPNAILQLYIEPARGIVMVGFNDQGRPLTLAEALDRAAQLRRWFGAGGFLDLPLWRGVHDSRGFRVANAPHALARPHDRAVAEARLGDETHAILEMNLFRLGRGRHELLVTVENWRRIDAIMTPGQASPFDACNGREWSLHVELSAR
jgi:hypothetical protein